MKKFIFLVFILSLKFLFSQPVDVTRDLPEYYTPGEEIEVILNVNVNENNKPNAIIISEKIPDNWIIKESNPIYNSFQNGEYKWLFYPAENINDTNIIYKILIPIDSTGSKEFIGKVKYIMSDSEEPYETEISGDKQIEPIPSPFLFVDKESLIFITENSLNLTICNLGGNNLTWTCSPSKNWISVSKTSGTLSSGGSEVLIVSVNRNGLNSGSYIGELNINTNVGNKKILIIMIVENVSPVKNASSYGFPGGVLLLWENPENYTGTIIFSKVGTPIMSNPLNSTYYGIPGNPDGYISTLNDGSICIFKDNTRKNSFIDNTQTDLEIFYNIYSFVDSYYSSPISTSSSRAKVLYTITIEDNNGREIIINNTNTKMDSFYINIPINAFEGDISSTNSIKFLFGTISSEKAPSHPGLLGFINIYSFKTENAILKENSYIILKVPVYYEDISNSGVKRLDELKVYYWNEKNKIWKECEKIEVINEPNSTIGLLGYIKVKIDDLGEINYISTGAPIVVPSSSGGCFIATACFDSPMAKEVKILKEFRDRILLRNKIGKAFVKWYYKHSPKYAEIIKNKPFLKKIVRVCLKPIIWIAKILV